MKGEGQPSPSEIMTQNKSVAIVGFSNVTLPYLKESKADEIWTMNHHLLLNEGKNLPRVDRLFEMHEKEWFLRKEIPETYQYWEWLRKPHPFPIYMLKAMPEVPSSVTYPREALKDDIFKHMLRGDGAQEYYTASASFMIALAIHEQFGRIEIYGIEAQTETEYGYQKPGIEFMIGVAIGRGIDVVLHPESHLCNSWIYGYELVPHLTAARLDELHEQYHKIALDKERIADKTAARVNSGKIKDKNAALTANGWRCVYSGGAFLLKHLRETYTDVVSQQHLEEQLGEYTIEANRWQVETAFFKGKLVAYNEMGNIAERDRAWKKYLDAHANMHAYSGACQVLKLLMRECAMEKVKHELKLMFTEEKT